MWFVAQVPLPESPAPTIFAPVYAVGCALGAPPVPTRGELTSVSVVLDRRTYYLASAPIIYGNSGGALFVESPAGWVLAGVPARVAVTRGNPVAHMAYFVPWARVRAWLTEQKLVFIWEPHLAPATCFAERDALRRQEKPNVP